MQSLSKLTEDEELFKQEIAKFSQSVIKPHVEEMDEKEQLKPEIIKQCFEMGLMGIEIPDQFGGANGSFFMSC